jgi:MEMO1 family protein
MGRRIRAFIALGILVLPACSREPRVYSTWASLGQDQPRTKPVLIESVPPADARPWAGTLSHHTLAGAEIDGWFALLSERRRVETFYILSPSHWGLSTQEFSITDGSWRVPGGLVNSDRKKSRKLAQALGVELEPAIFDPEHGVSALIPYIAKHFKNAKIVAIAYQGEPPLDQPMAQRLYQALSPAFDDRNKKKNFLLISTDFSHHGDRAVTDERDARSRRFFDAPSSSTWIFAGCDNRPGIYVLAKMLSPETKSSVLYHCDSLLLSGEASDDITTYFFSFFW